MRVKVTNPRSGAIDYVSHIFRLNVPAYADKMLVDLPADTAEKWIKQLEKDGLIVEMVPVETSPAEPVLPTPVEPEAEEKKPEEKPAPEKKTIRSKLTPAKNKRSA